jgi:group I intron endonuclease
MLIGEALNLKSGIYKILNIKNNKFYIGSAVNLIKRKNQHFSNLRHCIHPNIHLQRSFTKHGQSSFQFIILERCDKSILIKREQFYIDTLNPTYNICRIAGSCLGTSPSLTTRLKISIKSKGRLHTTESKIKMSIFAKGRKMTEKQKKDIASTLSIPVVQFDKDDNFIKEFKNQKEACIELGIAGISAVLKKKRILAGNFKWKYKTEVSC